MYEQCEYAGDTYGFFKVLGLAFLCLIGRADVGVLHLHDADTHRELACWLRWHQFIHVGFDLLDSWLHFLFRDQAFV